ncbi:G-protein coupled receptor family C group 5 member C [Tympanuchus pallidicinctus]|uniref:G-protein coupled receptor family C group 5 member C n=1 Tax=Tympanuchus pallidicinctus TaxID=109042 RepID=UPI00228769D3|nr:G-protein coupled receptor family C group 5 member C [Tympanuchus pallidicinctus]
MGALSLKGLFPFPEPQGWGGCGCHGRDTGAAWLLGPPSPEPPQERLTQKRCQGLSRQLTFLREAPRAAARGCSAAVTARCDAAPARCAASPAPGCAETPPTHYTGARILSVLASTPRSVLPFWETVPIPLHLLPRSRAAGARCGGAGPGRHRARSPGSGRTSGRGRAGARRAAGSGLAGTARHGTARHGTARHGTARHGTARHGTARHGTAQRRDTGRWSRVRGSLLGTHLPCRMGAAVLAAACILLALLPVGRAQSTPPSGCSQDLSSLYYNLCDLSAAWGIVLEAAASLGAVTSFVLTIVLVASLPFVEDPQKKSLVATQAFFLLGTFGLFCLTFDFIVGPDFSTCTSRRFLFGVLFALCFSCLLAHAVALNFLARRNCGPRGWVTLAVALLLALVEVIINAEWLIITVARQEGGPTDPCGLADADFVMALIYVMVLLVAAFGTAWPALCGRYTRWRKHGAFILATSGLSMAIWVAWTAMYLYGNQHVGKKPGWDDPTLAIALVSNAYAFILLYVIPEVTHVTRRSSEQGYEDDVYPTRGVGYETILKEQKSQSMFVENKAFSMDEPSFAKKPVSPYSGYNGQLLTSVYQPTEMALMHKGTSEGPYDVILPRATTASSASSTLRAEDAFAVQARHAAAQRDARGSQVLSPYSRNRW